MKTALPGYDTRRAHALARIEELEGRDEPEIAEARAWALENLPPETASSLLHGDLLPQNVLIDLEGGPPGLIDWEYAMRGDPACEFAALTRGIRRPFDGGGVRSSLLAAYGDGSVCEHEVRLHELCLLTAWYREGPSRSEAGA